MLFGKIFDKKPSEIEHIKSKRVILHTVSGVYKEN